MQDEAIAREIAGLRELLDALKAAVAREKPRCDLAQWGQFSHDWNRRRDEFLLAIDNCGVRCDQRVPYVHAEAHLLARRLFGAWERIHYTLTRGKDPDGQGLTDIALRLHSLEEFVAARREGE